MTVDQLSGVAMGLNASVVGNLKKGPWTELDRDALAETAAEVDKGWLSECPEIDMKRHFIAKRFPIKQRNKMRLIDDFSSLWGELYGRPAGEDERLNLSTRLLQFS